MIDYIEERINQLYAIYRSNINQFCITFLNAMEGMGKRTTIKGFLDKIGCADFVKIVPYGSTYPLGEFASALNKFEQESEQNIGEDLNHSKKRENIKNSFLRLLDTRQRLIVIFENFNHFDIETAFFILELAKSFINMNVGKTILFLISHDEIISYDLRNGIKNLGRYTSYLLFPDWAERDLTDLFNNIYPNSKISHEYLDQIIQCSFKNAGVFLSNVEYLKERGYIYLENQFLVCRRFPQEILFGNYREVIQQRYDLLQNMDVSSKNVLRLRIQVTTLLCSIEETLLIDSYQAHFNEAATLARTHQFSDLYYSLLRLSGIAYSGDICIKLLRTAAKHFSTRNKIEYAMCLHNLATEQLFSPNPRNSLKNFSKACDIFYECGHNGIVCVRNGLSMYYDLHTRQYEKALSYIDNFATDYDEDFLLLVVYYNLTTILRKLGRNREAREYLKKTVNINKKKGNKLPYFTRFIYAQEGYFALEKNDLERAWRCFEAFFHHDYPDRTEYLLSAAITLVELSERMGRPLPADIQQAAATQNQLAKRLAQEKLIFCEVLFWE